MRIGILVIVGIVGLYLAWCLAKGKIFVTLGTDLHKNTKLISREDRPATFWITWITSVIVLIIFAIYLIRAALN